MGYRIAECRKNAGLTQEELARSSDVSRTIISGLESGTITVTTTKTLERIARALGLKVSDIFLDEEFNILNDSETKEMVE